MRLSNACFWPSAPVPYPHGVAQPIGVAETHISWVLLARL